jgi:Transglutaminase-like superfamily
VIERGMAATAAIVVPVALRFLSLRATLRLCDAWPRTPGARASATALARRVDRWLGHGRGPWRSTCLTRALVLYAMLRQHGYVPRLHLGASGSAREFRAHSWLSLGGVPVAEPHPPSTDYRELSLFRE